MSSLSADVRRIQLLNDNLRLRHDGGVVLLSQGMAVLPLQSLAEIVVAVAEFAAFTPDNDPYGEHDCATVESGSHTVIFKIDYYAPDMLHHSDDPTDPEITRRVMTIMLAEEY